MTQMRVDLIPVERAVDAIPDGSSIVVSAWCGTPTTLLSAVCDRAEARDWTVLTGLIFDPASLVDAVDRGDLR